MWSKLWGGCESRLFVGPPSGWPLPSAHRSDPHTRLEVSDFSFNLHWSESPSSVPPIGVWVLFCVSESSHVWCVSPLHCGVSPVLCGVSPLLCECDSCPLRRASPFLCGGWVLSSVSVSPHLCDMWVLSSITETERKRPVTCHHFHFSWCGENTKFNLCTGQLFTIMFA